MLPMQSGLAPQALQLPLLDVALHSSSCGLSLSCLGRLQMPDLARVRIPPANLPKSPGTNTSPLSTNSIIPLYEPSWNAPARLDQLLSLSRHQLLPEGVAA